MNQFNKSALIEYLNETISKEEIASEISFLLTKINLNSPELINFISSNKKRKQLHQISTVNSTIQNIKSNENKAQQLINFFIVRELNSLMFKHQFDEQFSYPLHYLTLLEIGAENLFLYGKEQFKVLYEQIKKIHNNITKEKLSDLIILESPIGNILPNKLLTNLLKKDNISFKTYSLRLPRNDTSNKGLSYKDRFQEFSDFISNSNQIVIYIDDCLTGTRFQKNFKELEKIKKRKNIQIIYSALVFKTLKESQNKKNDILKDLKKKIEMSNDFGWLDTWIKFPRLPSYKVKTMGLIRYELPVIWGEDGLISGVIKVNFLFHMLNQCKTILKELTIINSKLLSNLMLIWSKDNTGNKIVHNPIVLTNIFKEIFNCIDWDKAELEIRNKFPNYYLGDENTLIESNIKRDLEQMISLISNHIKSNLGERKSYIFIRAFWDSIEFMKREDYVKTERDYRYSPCIVELNTTTRHFFNHLVKRIETTL